MLFLEFFILLLVKQVLSQDAIEPLIVGGATTTIEDYPYQVAITVQVSILLQAFCGGFIVSENYILTAGHCLYGLAAIPEQIEVRGGSTFRDEGTIIPIKEFSVHPGYATNIKISPYDKDISCLRTSSPIEFSDTIQPVGLPPVNRNLTGIVTVTGWGKTQENNTQLPRILMAVDIPVLNNTVCKDVYGKIFTSNMWCGGDYESGGVSPCLVALYECGCRVVDWFCVSWVRSVHSQGDTRRVFVFDADYSNGDSGGAAVQDGIAVGIVSFGMTCGGVEEPAVFTHLAAPSVRDFISDYTGL